MPENPRKVCGAHGPNALPDFPDVESVRKAFHALVDLLQEHVSTGEIEKVLNQLRNKILEEIYFLFRVPLFCDDHFPGQGSFCGYGLHKIKSRVQIQLQGMGIGIN